MKKCSKIIVKGKVQGVAFRDFVQKEAQKLGLEGTVQNSPDGDVVIYVTGISDTIETLIDKLYVGSTRAVIDNVDEEPLIPPKDFRGVFRIIQ